MSAVIRSLRPEATIVVGGHVANLPDIERLIDADHIVPRRRDFVVPQVLGQDESLPIEHPEILSGFGGRTMGVKLSSRPENTAAVLIRRSDAPSAAISAPHPRCSEGKGTS